MFSLLVGLNLILEALVRDLNLFIAFLSLGERGPRELGFFGLTLLFMSFFLVLREGEDEVALLVLEVVE